MCYQRQASTGLLPAPRFPACQPAAAALRDGSGDRAVDMAQRMGYREAELLLAEEVEVPLAVRRERAWRCGGLSWGGRGQAHKGVSWGFVAVWFAQSMMPARVGQWFLTSQGSGLVSICDKQLQR